MSRKTSWKKYVSVLIAFALVIGSIAGMGNQKAEAAARKTIRSVSIMQGGKNVTKKTLKMKAGATKKLTVNAKTTKSKVALSKKNITFRSSNKKVVAVNKNGKLTAKKSGSAKIAVTISKKGFKTKKTWVKVSVEKTDKTPAATQSPAPAVPTKSPDVSGSTPVPTGVSGTDVPEIPTTNPAVTESPAPTGTPNATETLAPTGTPNAAETLAPTGTPYTAEIPVPTETLDATVTPAPTGTHDIAETTPIPTEIPDVPKEPDSNDSGKILVAYFSWSGTSERIAQNIIAQTGADSFRIERETPYSDDYNTVAYGEAKDEADNNSRPPLKDPMNSVAAYDKIILCYPIWWHTAPMTVGTFLERYDMTGKTIYPISQSASMSTSQYDQSVAFVRECAKGATVDDGLFTKDNNAIREYVENTVLK